ncbi:MAG: leucine-rich repeat domain-containing protein [Paludibacteraceae bacterium]
MKTKLFSLLLAIVASIGTMFAEKVQIGDLYYNLDATNQTAEVRSQNSDYPFGSTNITTADIPSSVTYNAVTYSVTSIGVQAFYNAHELQNLEIPEGVTEIGGAFYGCTYLEEMVLPSSVQSIGDNCFALCAKLTKITCNAVTPPAIEAKTFFDVKRQIPV